jgi:hypothetical protein
MIADELVINECTVDQIVTQDIYELAAAQAGLFREKVSKIFMNVSLGSKFSDAYKASIEKYDSHFVTSCCLY